MSDDTQLLGPMAPWVKAQIEAGRFASEAEAVQSALANLADQDAKVADLKALIAEGLDDVEAGRVYEYPDQKAMVEDILRGV